MSPDELNARTGAILGLVMATAFALAIVGTVIFGAIFAIKSLRGMS